MSGSADALHALLERTGSPRPDAPGLVLAPEGVGKTALLAHLGIQALLAEQKVLHVALGDLVDHVRVHYDEVLRARGLEGQEHATASVAIERRRMVLSYTERAFDPAHLADQVAMLADVAQFSPDLVLIDGLHEASWATHGQAIVAFTAKTGTPAWISISSEADGPSGPAAAVALRLVSERGAVAVDHLTPEGPERLPWTLDATTFAFGTPGQATPAPSLPAEKVTLYSGGAKGAEAAFGEAAERHGVREVSFTFEGHRQARTVGSVELSSRELEAGDVSLVYVSRRLHRTYNQHGLIRRVLQTLWHMVSRAQQIFVIGVIQDDKTVVGGTGWSVELARMWNKDLWVYDQDKHAWFHWQGDDWVEGTPTIHGSQICGTGTRYLDDEGLAAIEALFARSFAQ